MFVFERDRAFFPISPAAPRWTIIAAHLVPVAVLPSTLWRLAVLLAGSFDGRVSLPWWTSAYIATIMVVLEVLALLTVGLVSVWGEVVPGRIPVLAGRAVRPLAVVVPALVGSVLATVGGWIFAYDCYKLLTDPSSSDEMGGPVGRVLFAVCYVPLAAWGPLLGAVAIAYYRRRTRALLVGAAAELFAEKGYRNTSVIDIAERADVRLGSISRRFGTKESLLRAVLDDQLQSVSIGADNYAGDSLDQVMEYMRLPATRMLIGLHAEAMEADSPLREHCARLHEALRRGVQRRMNPDALPSGVTPELLAILLVGVAFGVQAQCRVDPGAVDLNRVRETLRTLLPMGTGAC
ncbi:TetR/AcrR family transcriptional regulator [Nocardia wallacei]|uniref:TetR/AcrR family transcriptional regulator n=1 Tax=Nocardia wallacei TaxID=480035 RepID=UPI0024566799|nr:TetR/AcrR family transcriptional regulator [Nocardia wallacei]